MTYWKNYLPLLLGFCVSFLIYSILVGLRASVLDLEIATFLSKISYVLTTLSSLFLFLTAYCLKGLKQKDHSKLIYLSLPAIFIMILLFLPDSVLLERHSFGWRVNLSTVFRCSYMVILFSYTLLAVAYLRKILEGSQ